jgi:hypothetical protein
LAAGANITLAGLTVGNGSVAVLGSGSGVFGTHSVMTVGGLNLNSTGVLDLNDNALVVTYTGSDPLGGIALMIADGQIVSSLVNAHSGTLAIGYAEASQVLASGGVWPWKGAATLTSGEYAVLIMPTLKGDTNMNGQVDALDVFNVQGNYGSVNSGATWRDGDMNGNGMIDALDVFTAQGNYPDTMVSLGYWPSDALGASLGGLGGVSGSPMSVQVTVVPEPTTLALLAIGGAVSLAGGVMRRRRQSVKAAA